MNIGKELKLLVNKEMYNVVLVKQIANLPSCKLWLCEDDANNKYILSEYDGLYGFSYSFGKYEDGLFGTKDCKIVTSLLHKLKVFFKKAV